MRLLSTIITLLSLFGLVLSNAACGNPNDLSPRLRLEPGMHFAQIKRVAIDKAQRFIVTASDDKTARVWDSRNGRLLTILRPPIGEGHLGELYAIAISPNGQWVVVAGRAAPIGKLQTIYIFNRLNGQLHKRLTELPSIINDLNFSPNGRYLAVALGQGGIRLYQTDKWQEIGRDTNYSGRSHSVSFNIRNELISTSFDGYLRLYSAKGHLHLLHKIMTQGGELPFFARFSPDSAEIAIGFEDTTNIEIRNAKNLSFIHETSSRDINNGNLSKVAWSRQGRYLYAAGLYDNDQVNPIVRWQKGRSEPNELTASQSGIMGILPLRDGGLVYASTDPTLGRLNSAGKVMWKNTAGNLDYQGYQGHRDFALNSTGTAVKFRYKKETRNGGVKQGQTSWSLEKQVLGVDYSSWENPHHNATGLKISDWENTYKPKLNGRELPIQPYERSYSLAISLDAKHFALGTERNVRLFNRNGTQRWEKPVPNAWAINISSDSLWVVAALGDGTIRWYAMNDGKEHLAFYLHTDEKRWVAWTPEGFYAASPGAEELIGYHLNNGSDKTAQFVQVDQLRRVYARKDLIVKALDSGFPQLAKSTLQRAGDVRQLLRADRLPPKVTTTTGRNQFNVQGANFALPIEIKNRGGGIGRIEYRIAGKTYGDPAPSGTSEHSQGENGVFRKKRSFTLPHGQTLMEVIAYSIDNKVASEPLRIVVNVNNPVRKKPSLHILSIGISDYKDDSLDLRFAASDAEDFADTLEQQTRTAIYQRINKTILLDGDVTLKRIRTELNRIAQEVQPQDVFVLYMAGHGMTVDGRYHFLPHNIAYSGNQALQQYGLSNKRLREWLMPIQAKKNLMILDTSDAGRSIQQLAIPRSRNTLTDKNTEINSMGSTIETQEHNVAASNVLEDKIAVGNLMESTGFAVLAANSSTQQALAGVINHRTKKEQGLFTHVLLNGLRGAADHNNDRRVSIRELAKYIHIQVPRLSQQKWKLKQFPMSQISGDDFIVSLRLER